MDDSSKYDWPGWELKKNKYGDEFDLNARKRMVKNSELLLPLIKKYKSKLGKNILEIGPFFNPLITPTRFPNKNVYYLENDKSVCNFSETEYGKKINVIRKNINKLAESYFEKQNLSFNSVIISQTINYVDYKKLIKILKNSLDKDSLIFINNTANYGVPKLFSEKRPKNNIKLINFLEENSFNIVELKKLTFIHKNKKYERLLIVAKKE